MAKINISMDDELLKRVDEMATALYTNRSAYISMTIAQVIKTQEDALGMKRESSQQTLKEHTEKKEEE